MGERAADLPAYLADNYGTCRLGASCICLDTKHPRHVGWLGRACVHWDPVKAASWEALAHEVRDLFPTKGQKP